MTRIVVLQAVAILAVACATITMAPESLDMAAKQLVPPPGKARVYVTRPGTQGAAGLADVMMDGRLVGQLAIQNYVYTDLEPGEHSIAWNGVHPFSVAGRRCRVLPHPQPWGYFAETMTPTAAPPFLLADWCKPHPDRATRGDIQSWCWNESEHLKDSRFSTRPTRTSPRETHRLYSGA